MLPKYKSIKDKYCIGYFGNNKSCLLQLEAAIPFIEKELSGITIYIACNNKEGLDEKTPIVLREELDEKIKNKEFAYFREIVDGECNPVKFLLDESNITYNEELFKTSA